MKRAYGLCYALAVPDLAFTLQRQKSSSEATLGVLTRDDAGWRCHTLEPPARAPHPPIPAGIYPVEMAWSPRLGRQVPHVRDVPGRDAIEIHPGNFPSETHGCLLLGAYGTEASLLDSRQTVHDFVVQLTTLGAGRATLTVESETATA